MSPADLLEAESEGEHTSSPQALRQQLKLWLPARAARRVTRDDLPLLFWPQGVPIGSPGVDHAINHLIEIFLATHARVIRTRG